MPNLRLLLSLALAAGALHAQQVNGAIAGAIRDASGSAVPNAAVRAVNTATSFEFRAATGAAGVYVLPSLPAGEYTVNAEAAGFKPVVRKAVSVLPSRTARVDINLEIGVVAQAVEVTAEVPAINSEDATIGNILDSRTIVRLPLNGRSLDRLIRISAGVTTDSASNPRIAGSAYWGGVQFNVDGVTFNDTGNGGAAYSFSSGLSTVPSVDSVSEFKIDSNNQKAEYEGSVAVTIVTKSGSNQFHGALYEFNRNKAYAARNGRALSKPPLNRNDFGGTLGGPVRRDRMFFFTSYEGLRERSSTTRQAGVATAAMREGDFTGLPALADPLAGGALFPGNRVPAARIDSRAKTLIGFVPLPNGPGIGPAGTLNNQIGNIGNVFDVNRWLARVDHRFTSRDAIFVSVNYSKGNPYFTSRTAVPNFGNGADFGYTTRSGQFTYNRNVTPALLNEGRLAWFNHRSVRQGQNQDFDPTSLFPDLFRGFSIGGLPTVTISNHQTIGDYGGGGGSPQYTTQLVDNVTYVRGRHTLKAGIDFAFFRNSTPPFAGGFGSGLLNEATYGRFDFNGRFTNNTTGAPQPAHAFADFLLGYPLRTYRSTPTAGSLFTAQRYSTFVQDDYRVSSQLTLNFGLRYMLHTAWRERDNGLANFNFATGQLVIPSAQAPPQAQAALLRAYPIVLDGSDDTYRADRNNFAPRLGFAYRPFRDGRTVLRGGAGIFHNPIPFFIGIRALNFSNPPFQLSETYEAAAGALPSLTLARPFTTTATVSANPSITVVERDLRNADSYQWNLTLERSVAGNIGLRASYVGNHTAHLPYNGRQLNNPRGYAPGQVQPRRPYQPWAAISLASFGGDSTIHQLQLEAVKRYSSGLSFQVEYSWNRSLDNTPISGGPEDPYNNARDRGNSDQIRRHTFTTAWSYELPFGAGKRWLRSARGPAQHLVGGWQLAGITYLRTGQPFNVAFNTSVVGWSGGRPDALRPAALPRGERSADRWFDASAFAVPTPFTFGSAPRNALFAPGDIVFDLSALKDTRLREGVNLQFRLEAFNAPNHANLGGPGANISVPASVGRITSVGDPRQVQLGLKLLF